MEGTSTGRQMSTTEIDLESVLQVRRRRLSVTTPQASQDAHRYTDVIFLKVEKSLDILKEDARCVFHGDYHVLTDIFQKYTAHIKIHHQDPETVKTHDRLSGKLYTTLELPTMSLIEVLEILHKHFFSIVANSTHFGPTLKTAIVILLVTRLTLAIINRVIPLTPVKSHQLLRLYTSHNIYTLILITLILLITMVIVVKLSSRSKGPLRTFIT